MTARQIDGAGAQLHELRVQSLERLGLAVAAFGLALLASQARPTVAPPLLVGALALTFLGLRALVRRWFLLEDLAADPDAYELPEVRRFGARVASLAHRRALAQSLRGTMEGSTSDVTARAAALGPELLEIIAVLEDERYALEPRTAVAIDQRLREIPRLLGDPSLSVDELRAALRNLLCSLGR